MNEIIDDGRNSLLNHDRETFKRARAVIDKGTINLDENFEQMAQNLEIDLNVLKEDTKDKQIESQKDDIEIIE